MRGLRSTIALVVVLAGLGAYIYFVDSGRPTGGVEAKAKVFAVEADTIEELTVTAGGETTVLQKKDGAWTMTAPVATGADETEISSLTSNLSSLEINRVVDDNAADLSAYGLAPPRVQVAFKAPGNNSSGEILLGDKTPTQGDLYAVKAGEKKVFLVSSYLETTFDKKPFDLRDKRILKFERDKADSLQLAQGAEATELSRAGSEWKVVKPIAARADYSTVEGLMTRLSTASMSKLIESDAKDLAKYGLDKPAASITIGTGSSRAVLQVGRTENDQTYARDESRPTLVFTLDSTLAGDVKKGIDEYRKKDLFDFRSYNAARLRMVREAADGAKTYELERVKAEKAGDADTWRLTTQGAPPRAAEASNIDDLLNKLTTLRAQSFVDAKTKTGLEKPLLIVSVSYDEGRFERVRLGRAGPDAFGSHDGESGAGKLETTAFDDALKAFDAAVAPPAPAPPANASPSAPPQAGAPKP